MRVSWLLACLLASVAKGAEPPYVLLKPGDRPPALELRTLEGETLTWADLKGNAVVLDFWATWCPPCITAIPHLNAFVEEFKDKPVRFISVTYEKKEVVEPFLSKRPLKTAIALDPGCATFRSFKAWGIPMVVLVGADDLVKGVIQAEDLSSGVVRRLLEGEAPGVAQAHPYKDPKGAEEYFCGGAKAGAP